MKMKNVQESSEESRVQSSRSTRICREGPESAASFQEFYNRIRETKSAKTKRSYVDMLLGSRMFFSKQMVSRQSMELMDDNKCV